MHSSKVIEADGVFIGVAVLQDDARSWRFVSADARANEADGAFAPTLHEASTLARRAFITARRFAVEVA